MARVNIGRVQWEEFLRRATSADRSVADYPGHLVRKELRRLARREGLGPTGTLDAKLGTCHSRRGYSEGGDVNGVDLT